MSCVLKYIFKFWPKLILSTRALRMFTSTSDGLQYVRVLLTLTNPRGYWMDQTKRLFS